MKFSNVKFYSKYHFNYTFCAIFDNFHNKGEKVVFEWFCKYIFEILGGKGGSKVNFCGNQKCRKSFKEHFSCLKFFFVEPTEAEITAFLKKGGGSLEGKWSEKMAPKLIFF